MESEKRLSLNQGLEVARREAKERQEGAVQPAPVAEAAFETPEDTQEAAPAVILPAAAEVARTVGFDGTLIETNVALDAPPPGAWRYQPKPQTRRASSLPTR
ncbi:hypothetical protein [Phenylobacterium sp.]|uniref:hypothetical protein n=1 Tax=Phenylobacterium sp. TaxID=1871053 RepID=UPI0035AD78AF